MESNLDRMIQHTSDLRIRVHWRPFAVANGIAGKQCNEPAASGLPITELSNFRPKTGLRTLASFRFARPREDVSKSTLADKNVVDFARDPLRQHSGGILANPTTGI